MKPKKSCESCRQRHRRCIRQPGAARCNGCDEVDAECDVTPSFQFHHWKHNTEAAAGDIDSRHVEQSTASSETHRVPSGWSHLSTPGTDHFQTGGDGGSPSLSQGITGVSALGEYIAASGSQGQTQYRPAHPDTLGSLESVGIKNAAVLVAPALGEADSRLNQREAFLFRTWVQRIALMSDAVDEARHFGVTVSKLSLEHPVLLNGILALASRFDAISTGNKSDVETTYYHGRCIELLIERLSKPTDTYDSTLLAAVVISRLFEENDADTDALTYHLNGTQTLLSNDIIMRLAREGGLAEAACWVHLRQAIYMAIVRRQHLEVPLVVYEELTAFRKTDDTSCANRIVHLFAQILGEFFPEPTNESSPRPNNDWSLYQQKLDVWFETKPSSFEPLYHEPQDSEAGKPFPSMWMMSTVQTVALQYYHASMIVLCLTKHNGNPGSGGFEVARQRRNIEKSIISHLFTLMGLAISNTTALNAWYLPCHMLDLCGYFIHSSLERLAVITYLEKVRQEVQWKTASVIEALRMQWAELDGFGTPK